MLTPRQNMMEVIKGGNPDRFVKQYEALEFVMTTPYLLEYPTMPEGPGRRSCRLRMGLHQCLACRTDRRISGSRCRASGMPGHHPLERVRESAQY